MNGPNVVCGHCGTPIGITTPFCHDCMAKIEQSLVTPDKDWTTDLERDVESERRARLRLVALLTEIAIALKGPEKDGQQHSFHDLPELVRAQLSAPDLSSLPRFAIFDKDGIYEHPNGRYVLFSDVESLYGAPQGEGK